MPKIRTLGLPIAHTDTRTVRLLSKQKASIYDSPEFKAWRARVVTRADFRCEAIEQGHRCGRAWPEHRLYADHIRELRDGGKAFDLNNGQCLCASHHELKTIEARSRRFGLK